MTPRGLEQFIELDNPHTDFIVRGNQIITITDEMEDETEVYCDQPRLRRIKT